MNTGFWIVSDPDNERIEVYKASSFAHSVSQYLDNNDDVLSVESIDADYFGSTDEYSALDAQKEVMERLIDYRDKMPGDLRDYALELIDEIYSSRYSNIFLTHTMNEMNTFRYALKHVEELLEFELFACLCDSQRYTEFLLEDDGADEEDLNDASLSHEVYTNAILKFIAAEKRNNNE